MHILFLLLIAFLLYVSIFLRTVIFHLPSAIKYTFIDIYHYFKFKKWQIPPQLGLVCYQGLFGKGKTLSAVHDVVKIYNRYNDLIVYDSRDQVWKLQKIQVISNVSLAIPYVPFESLQQIVNVSKQQDQIDDALGIITYTIILGDEFSVQMNSRSFKENISTPFLNTLLTSRHYRICALLMTSQRFNLCDKLLRDVTSHVIDCNKIWRVMSSKKYDAWELENASDVTNIKPLYRYGWFIHDSDFQQYNTYAVVDQLIKKCEEGDLLSDEEILQLREAQAPDIGLVSNTSRKYRKRIKTNTK